MKCFEYFTKEPLEYCIFIWVYYNILLKMTQYSSVNVKVSNSQVNKLNSA